MSTPPSHESAPNLLPGSVAENALIRNPIAVSADDSATTLVPPSEASIYMVLLVDDQAMIGETVRRMLANQPDIDFHYCGTSTEAVAAVEAIKPGEFRHLEIP